jgi:hypothetical protein
MTSSKTFLVVPPVCAGKALTEGADVRTSPILVEILVEFLCPDRPFFPHDLPETRKVEIRSVVQTHG